MEAIGFIGVDVTDKEARTLDWIWQLSMQETKTWAVLMVFIQNWVHGKALGQKKAIAKVIEKQAVGNKKMVEQRTLSPVSKSKSGRPVKKKQKRMATSALENEKSVQTSKPVLLDIPGKKEWDNFAGMNQWDSEEGGDMSSAQYKYKLFKQMANNEISIQDASQKAKLFKAMQEAKNDFMVGVEVDTWTEARQKYPSLTCDKSMEVAARDYMISGNKKVQNRDKGKKITLQMENLIKRAKRSEEEAASAQTGEDSECTVVSRTVPLTEEQLAQGFKTKMLFKCFQGDATDLVNEGFVKKRPYRLVYMDIPYEDWSLDKFEACLDGIAILNSSEYQTLIVTCGESEREKLMDVAKKHYNSTEHVYWYKPNAMVTGLNRHAKQIEVGFIAYKCTAEGSVGMRPHTMFFDWDAGEQAADLDDEGNPIEGTDRASDQSCKNSNVFEFNKVTKLMIGSNGKVINVWQKPLALCEYWIARYCIGGDWVLELCAGSASFSAAAIRLNKNAITADIDARQAREAEARLERCLYEDLDNEVGLQAPTDDEAEAEAHAQAEAQAQTDEAAETTSD